MRSTENGALSYSEADRKAILEESVMRALDYRKKHKRKDLNTGWNFEPERTLTSLVRSIGP